MKIVMFEVFLMTSVLQSSFSVMNELHLHHSLPAMHTLRGGRMMHNSRFLWNKNYSSNISKVTISQLSVISSSCMLGSHYICTKVIQHHVEPSFLTFMRFFLGSIIFFPHLLTSPINSNILRGGIELGIYTALGYISDCLVLQYTTASKTAFLCGLGVILIPFLDKYIKKKPIYEKEPPYNLYGPPLLTFIGLSFLVAPINTFPNGDIISSYSSPSLLHPLYYSITAIKWKDIMLPIGPLLFAIATWRGEDIVNNYDKNVHHDISMCCQDIDGIDGATGKGHGDGSSNNNKNTLSITAVTLVTASIISFLWYFIQTIYQILYLTAPSVSRRTLTIYSLYSFLQQLVKTIKRSFSSVFASPNPFILPLVLYLGLIVTSVVNVVEQKALTTLSANEMTVLYSTEPLFGAAIAWYFLNEPFTFATIVAGACTIIACLWSSKVYDGMT